MKRIRFTTRAASGFTLIELMVVVGVMALMMALVIPAFTAMAGGSSLVSTAASIKELLQQARSYAMANNTFVFVGVTEVSGAQGSSVSPQAPGTGRVALGLVASRDGTCGYDPNNPQGGWLNTPNNGANLVSIDRLQHFDNFHLADFSTFASGTGGFTGTGAMTRPALQSTRQSVGNPKCVSATQFSWPLGSVYGSGQYNFSTVIEFDPQGVARIQLNNQGSGTTGSTVVTYLEIDLQPAHGSTFLPVTDPNTGNIAAIQITGITGAVQAYMP